MGARVLSLCMLLATGLSRGNTALAQSESEFRTVQFASERVLNAWQKYNEPLSVLFARKDLQWPANDLFIRAFKQENELEIWARDRNAEKFKHVKTYRICALSGKLGPKRKKGDKQVPEGYYFIEDFNAQSEFHLSLGLSYPNYSDIINARGQHAGGDIYIHGGCLTVGCLPMEDEGIREIYILCLNARLNGQNYIPVHVFPTRLTNEGLSRLQRDTNYLTQNTFWRTLKEGYDYFETHHKLLPVMYTTNGNYIN